MNSGHISLLTHDAEAKIYEVHPGIGSNIAPILGLPEGPSLHFVLNNEIFEDNRIPPRGFTNAAFEAFGGSPVGHHYDDLQHLDDSKYVVPPTDVRAEVNLYYQSTSKEFVEFLRDENTTNSKGQEMYDLWNDNGKCPPTLMESASYDVLPAAGDADFDGLSNIEELAFGSNPNSASSRHMPEGFSLHVDSSDYPAIAFVRGNPLQGAGIVVEVSDDLSDWSPAAPEDYVEHSVTDNGDGTESVVVRLTAPLVIGQPKFIRLSVEAN